MMNNNNINRRQSRGEMISSVAFLGVGIWFFLEALVAFQLEESIKAISFCIFSFLNFIATFRFQIARLYARRKE
jgi:hypothetical protein